MVRVYPYSQDQRELTPMKAYNPVRCPCISSVKASLSHCYPVMLSYRVIVYFWLRHTKTTGHSKFRLLYPNATLLRYIYSRVSPIVSSLRLFFVPVKECDVWVCELLPVPQGSKSIVDQKLVYSNVLLCTTGEGCSENR